MHGAENIAGGEELRMSRNATSGLIILGLGAAVAACTPTVKVEAPTEPITINLNVKIEHEVRIKVDREVEELFDDNADIFGES